VPTIEPWVEIEDTLVSRNLRRSVLDVEEAALGWLESLGHAIRNGAQEN
jgi:hypothetical protein